MKSKRTWFEYPSKKFPGLPAVRLSAPATWTSDAGVNALIAISDPDSPPGFLVNLVVSAIRVPATSDLDSLAEALQLGDDPDSVAPLLPSAGEDAVMIAGHPAIAQFQRLEAKSDAGLDLDLTQLQVGFLVPANAESSWAFTINGSCLAEDVERYGAIFVESCRSLELKS